MSKRLVIYESAVVLVFIALWLWSKSLPSSGDPPLALIVCLPGVVLAMLFGPGVHSGNFIGASMIYSVSIRAEV